MPAIEIAANNPEKTIVFEDNRALFIDKAKIYKVFLGLNNFSERQIAINLSDMSKPEPGHSNVLGICLPHLDRIKGRVVVGPMKMEVNRLEAAAAMVASLERSHPMVIMTSDSFLFSKGGMSQVRGFLLETGRLFGVIALRSKQSFQRSMVATNLLFLSSSEKNLNEFPIYFGSTRGTFGDLNEAAELGQLILSNEQTSKNTHTVMGSWVGRKIFQQ